MEGVQYLHCSMMGSYYIDCEVLSQIDEQHFRIQYEDFDDRIVTEVVTLKYLKFPRFVSMP